MRRAILAALLATLTAAAHAAPLTPAQVELRALRAETKELKAAARAIKAAAELDKARVARDKAAAELARLTTTTTKEN
jgi:hypothetical protein